MEIDIRTLATLLDGVLSENTDGSQVIDTVRACFDTRKLKREDLFIAISTEKQDGAKYIKDAFDKGAILAIAQSNPDSFDRVLVVEDSLKAFQKLGLFVRSQYKGFVIGITGSSGKTTSKELIAHMLSHFGRTCFTEGSFNNHIGTPYNLCRLDLNAPYAVFEMGMDHGKEISALVELVRPNMAVVTNVFPMHMENFGKFEDIAFAKAEIFEKMEIHDNRTIALINADTNFAEEVLIPQAKKLGVQEIVTFGKKGKVRLDSFSINKDCKTEVIIEIDGRIYRHADHGLGERFAYNANLAVAVAFAMGLDEAEAIRAIADFSPLKGRGKISKITIAPGLDITLIDDSYNGQPEAVRYAISTLNAIPKNGARKVALLGKMSEIGAASEEEHRSVGRALAQSDVDVVIGVGEEMRFTLAEIPNSVTKIFRNTIDGLYEDLRNSILRPHDILLIKGAHYASRLFEVAENMLAQIPLDPTPEDARLFPRK